MNIWIMSLISMFPPLTWWLLGGGGGFRRRRRRCRCRCHCCRCRCQQRLTNYVVGGGSSSSMRESSFPLVISAADAAVRGGQGGREGGRRPPSPPLSVSPQALAIFLRAAAAASNPPLLPLHVRVGRVRRRRAFLRPPPGRGRGRPAVTLDGGRQRGSWLLLDVRLRESKTQPHLQTWGSLRG